MASAPEEESHESESDVAEVSAGDNAPAEGIELTTESEASATVGEASEQDGEEEGKPSSGSAATSKDE
jgi:hypothetical protein